MEEEEEERLIDRRTELRQTREESGEADKNASPLHLGPDTAEGAHGAPEQPQKGEEENGAEDEQETNKNVVLAVDRDVVSSLPSQLSPRTTPPPPLTSADSFFDENATIPLRDSPSPSEDEESCQREWLPPWQRASKAAVAHAVEQLGSGSGAERLSRLQCLLQEEALFEGSVRRAQTATLDRVSQLQRLTIEVRMMDTQIDRLVHRQMSVRDIRTDLTSVSQRSMFYKPLGFNQESEYVKLLVLAREDPQLLSFSILRYITNGWLTIDDMETLSRTLILSLYGSFTQPQEEKLLLALLNDISERYFRLVAHPRDILRGNFFLSRLLSTYTKRANGHQYLVSVLQEPITAVLQEPSLLLELDPLQVYHSLSEPLKQRVSASFRGGPVTPDLLGQHPEIMGILHNHQVKVVHHCSRFLKSITDHLHVMPYGIRWLSKQFFRMSSALDPPLREADVRVVISDFIFNCFIGRGIANPEAYGIITEIPTGRGRRNLQIVLEVLQHVARGSLFEDAGFGLMNAFIQQSQFASYFEILVAVDEPSSYLEVPGHLGSISNQPVIIHPNDLFNIHRMLLEVRKGGMFGGAHHPIDRVLYRIREVPNKVAPEDNRFIILNLTLPSTDVSLGMRPPSNLAPTVDQTIRKLFSVIRNMDFISGIRNGSVLDVLEQERAMATASGAHSLSTHLFEVIYCLRALPAEFTKDDYIPILSILEKEYKEREATRPTQLVTLREMATSQECIQRRIDSMHMQRRMAISYLNSVRIRSLIESKKKRIASLLSEIRASQQPTGVCSGRPSIDNDEFVCPLCLKAWREKQSRLANFTRGIEKEIQENALWRGSTKEEMESALDGLVNYVMGLLHNRCQENDAFYQHTQNLQMITPDYRTFYHFISNKGEGLDLLPCHEESLLLAQEELLKIKGCRTPRDKLNCMVQARKTIWDLLQLSTIPSADDFMPMLCYVILKANPPAILSNVQYVSLFSRRTIAVEKDFVDFQVAVKLLMTLNPARMRAQRTSDAPAVNPEPVADSPVAGKPQVPQVPPVRGRPVVSPVTVEEGHRFGEAASDALFQNMIQMGFPPQDVSFGIDMFGGEKQKVLEFLDNCGAMREVGFPDDDLREALVMNGNQRQEAITWLLDRHS